MKKHIALVVLVLVSMAFFVGCGRQISEEKIGKLEIKEEGITGEQVVPAPFETQVPPPPTGTQLAPPTAEKIAPPVAEPMQAVLPPAKPETVKVGEGTEWNRKIQTALKNAGFYNGAIDGKLGPLSKKAIEDFQKAKGLKVDGVVGPKTWSELEKNLTQAPPPAPLQ